MLQNIEVGNKYTWIKGEHFGKEDIVSNTRVMVGNLAFVEFVSGRRCNGAILKEFMELILKADDLDGDPIEIVNGLLEKQEHPRSIKQSKPAIKASNSLYRDILDNIKSHEDSELSFNITVKLPKKLALEVLLDAYGADLAKELNAYIGEKISNDVNARVQTAVGEWIEELNIEELSTEELNTEEDEDN